MGRCSIAVRKLLKDVIEQKFDRVVGVDPSTTKIAFVLIEKNQPISNATIDLGSGDIYDRLLRLRKYYPSLLRRWNPGFVCIEQAIFVQNPETSRKIAYSVGIIAAETRFEGIQFADVAPSTWKSFLGVKPLNVRWKTELKKELGEKDGNKEINRLKKSQTQDILRNRYPRFNWDDTDIADACGIALYAYSSYGSEYHPDN